MSNDLVERLRGQLGGFIIAEEAADEIERLRAVLRYLRPDIAHLERIEASSEDGNTPRLQMLRRALEPKP